MTKTISCSAGRFVYDWKIECVSNGSNPRFLMFILYASTYDQALCQAIFKLSRAGVTGFQNITITRMNRV